jgi:ATP-binding cassette, subfamily B, bacterial
MKLLTTPPQAIIHSLSASGISQEQLKLSLDSDIDLHGAYHPQWVIATEGSVFAYDDRKPEKPLFAVTLEEAQEFRTTSVVGAGILQVKVGGTWLDIVRYSNGAKYHFARLVKRLEQLRKKEAFVLDDEDHNDPRRCTISGIVLDYPGQSSPFAAKSSAALSRVMQLMKPYWKMASVMMALLVLGVALDMTAPLLIRYLVDNVLGQAESHDAAYAAAKAAADIAATQPVVEGVQATQDAQVGPKAGMIGGLASQQLDKLREQYPPVMVLFFVVVLYAGIQITRSVVNLINGRLGSRVGTAITFDMRARLVDHLQQLSLSYYDKQSVGSLVGRVAYDTEAVQGFVAQFTSGFLMQLLMVVLAAVFMFSLEPTLFFWTMAPAPLIMLLTYLFWQYVYPNYERFWDRSNKQAGMLNGLFSGIRVIKAFAQEDREYDRFQASSTKLRDARVMVDSANATFGPIVAVVFGAGGWIVWYVGGKEVLGDRLTLGTLIAFFSYLGLFYGPLAQLTNLTTWLTQFATQMQRIFEVLDTPVTIPNAKNPVSMPKVKGDIEFKNVVFGYSRQNPILKGVSFEIKAGQMIGVVGRSGSGKTTIINLISRFYDIDDGTILIDGHEIRQIKKSDLRSHVGVVLQEPFLFKGTLWENLVYGRSGSTIEEGITAARAGNAHDFILKQVQGYDTWVGERGAGLSGGERQRLSIARALLCEPSILILDEATSAIDSESELAIQQALAELVKGRTSIIIAHRLSTLRNCDKIMVIDDGKLAEMGSHAELMKLDKKYAKLVKIQGSAQQSDGIDSLVAQENQEKDKTESEKKPGKDGLPPELTPDAVTGMTPITGHKPRWLSPEFVKIHLGNNNALHCTVQNERIYNGMFALRCMPVRHPEKYISLRWFNSENREQEIGLIRDLSQWPVEAQSLIRESLARRYHIHTINEVEAIRHEHNYLFFKAKTDLGDRDFIVRWSHDNAHDYGDNGKVLIDVEENRYLVPDVDKLPEPGKKAFLRYIFW